MPTVLRVGPYRFYFYSADGDEARHIHIGRDDREAKYWLDPTPRMAFNHGFNSSELRQVAQHIQANLEALRRGWDEFFT